MGLLDILDVELDMCSRRQGTEESIHVARIASENKGTLCEHVCTVSCSRPFGGELCPM